MHSMPLTTVTIRQFSNIRAFIHLAFLLMLLQIQHHAVMLDEGIFSKTSIWFIEKNIGQTSQIPRTV